MKIEATRTFNLNSNFQLGYPDGSIEMSGMLPRGICDLKCMPCYYPISFTSIQNSSKLRMLFAYKLPCMYSGIPMIDPKILNRWMKNGLGSKPISEVLNVLSDYKDSFTGVQDTILNIIKERANNHPNYTLSQVLAEISPVYNRRLRKKQAPVFKELKEIMQELPEKYRYRFTQLMVETGKKINGQPIIKPFSSYEFKYKLSKIKDDIHNH